MRTTLNDMRRFAFLLALLAWLFQGLMPALALPMAAGGMPMMRDHPIPGAEATISLHPHGKLHETAMTSAEHADRNAGSAGHCRDCADTHHKTGCAMSLCAACTSLVPPLVLAGGHPMALRYPAPLPDAVLLDRAPAPLDPPPRA